MQNATYVEGRCHELRGPDYWADLEHVSDDGRTVTICARHGDWRSPKLRLEVWDVRSATMVTPPHWYDPEWRDLMAGGMYIETTGLRRMLAHPSGREFLHDGQAWAALGERFVTSRAYALDDLQKTVRPLDKDEGRELYPNSIRFSPDGRFVSYHVRNGWPVYGHIDDSLVDGTAIDDIRTGRRIAMLPGVTREVEIAPGGRTAASVNVPENKEGDQPWLSLWSLEESRVETEILLPGRPTVGFSPDGRYVFAKIGSPEFFRWWDTETGKLVGDIAESARPRFFRDGRVLVLEYRNDPVLHFWDLAAGREISEWEPTGVHGNVSSTGNTRYLAATYFPDLVQSTSKSTYLTDKIADWVSDRIPNSRSSSERDDKVMVLDAVERREASHVPGLSAAISDNDRWLATLDADGVVRVWELPLRRPWGRGMLYAAAIMMGGWFVLTAVGRLRRIIGDSSSKMQVPSS